MAFLLHCWVFKYFFSHCVIKYNMYYIFIGYVSILLILLWKVIICPGQLQSSLRISKAMNCNMTGLKWIVNNVTVHYYYPKTYMYVHYNVIEDIKKIKKVFIHIERCNERGYDCEDFQNYWIDRFCHMVRLKNQAWSEYVSRFHPPMRCPVKKASYEIRNASLDIDALMNWFPEMAKYLWKTFFKLTNEQDRIVFCGSFEAQLYQFRLQDRKPPRKPRPSI